MDRQIFIFSVIDSYSSEYIIRQLLDLDRQSDDEITMFINSPGGSVISMLAIVDAMKIIKAPIRTIIVGMAASAASVIASAGNTRLISESAQVMIHEASAGAFGSISNMKEDLEQFERLNELMVNILSKNTNNTVDFVKEAMNKKDKYFSSKEAIDFGLVDRIINDEEAQSLKLSESINVEGYEISGKEVQLLRDGDYVHPVYGRMIITESILQKMKLNFENNVRGCEVSIDYTHDNDSGESPAAFWIKSLIIKSNKDGKGKGLFAIGEFTPMGEKKISEKEYKYSSADFRIDYVDQHGKHHPYVLCGGTLTNRPFIKNMNPIKLSEKNYKEARSMNKDELIAELKKLGIDVVSMVAGNEVVSARVKELEAKITELNALPVKAEAEIKVLKDSLLEANETIVTNDKTVVFEGLVSEGKCTPAQKESIFKTFKSAEEISSFYKDSPVAVAIKPKGSKLDGSDDVLTDSEAKLVAAGDYTKEEIIEARVPLKKK